MRWYVVWFQYSRTLHHFLIDLLTSVGLLTHLMPLNSLLNCVICSVLNRKAHWCFSFYKAYVGNCSLSLPFLKCYLKANLCQTPSWVKESFSHTCYSYLLLYILTAHTVWGLFDLIHCHKCCYNVGTMFIFPSLEKPATQEMFINSLLFCCSVSSNKIHAGAPTVFTAGFLFNSILEKRTWTITSALLLYI